MLADKAFCDMVHSIGVASLCADDKQIWHLTKIYWFTVEFGVVEEGDDIKAFGAGAFARLCSLSQLSAVAQCAVTSHMQFAEAMQVLLSLDSIHRSSLSAGLRRHPVKLWRDGAHAHWQGQAFTL